MRGESNLYIHCLANEGASANTKYAEWSDWTVQKYCDDRADYFKMKWRDCVKTQAGLDYEKTLISDDQTPVPYIPFCKGQWLNVTIIDIYLKEMVAFFCYTITFSQSMFV